MNNFQWISAEWVCKTEFSVIFKKFLTKILKTRRNIDSKFMWLFFFNVLFLNDNTELIAFYL